MKFLLQLKPLLQRNFAQAISAAIKPVLGLTVGSTLLLSGCNSEQPSSAENTVTILGVIVGEQQEKLEQALAPFEEETGIDVVYEGTDAFATLLPVRVESGDAPDLA
ncbi:MAG: hypothetical protein WBD47_11705, partial [Phormidesmis sp.]